MSRNAYYGTPPQDRVDAEYRYSYSATEGQTTFNALYTVGSVDVYVNGTKLGVSEFTANNGTTVVVGVTLVQNDEVQIIARKVTPVVGQVSPTDLTNGLATKADLAGSSAQDFATKNLTVNGLQNLKSGANIASAATIDLTAATGNTVTITGTTATSALTMNDGQHMTLVAAGAWPLTYHATNCNISGGVSVTAYAGQVFDVVKTGGVVRIFPRAISKAIYGAMRVTSNQTPPATTYTRLVCSLADSGASGVTFTDADDSLTITVPGRYRITVKNTSWDIVSASNNSIVRPYLNGIMIGSSLEQAAYHDLPAASRALCSMTTFYVYLVPNDVLTLYGYSTSGNVIFQSGSTLMLVERVGDN